LKKRTAEKLNSQRSIDSNNFRSIDQQLNSIVHFLRFAWLLFLFLLLQLIDNGPYLLDVSFLLNEAVNELLAAVDINMDSEMVDLGCNGRQP
jgi:hypothetical protein